MPAKPGSVSVAPYGSTGAPILARCRPGGPAGRDLVQQAGARTREDHDAGQRGQQRAGGLRAGHRLDGFAGAQVPGRRITHGVTPCHRSLPTDHISLLRSGGPYRTSSSRKAHLDKQEQPMPMSTPDRKCPPRPLSASGNPAKGPADSLAHRDTGPLPADREGPDTSAGPPPRAPTGATSQLAQPPRRRGPLLGPSRSASASRRRGRLRYSGIAVSSSTGWTELLSSAAPGTVSPAGLAHHGDDLIGRRRVGRVLAGLVRRRPPGMKAWRGRGERRRPAASRGH